MMNPIDLLRQHQMLEYLVQVFSYFQRKKIKESSVGSLSLPQQKNIPKKEQVLALTSSSGIMSKSTIANINLLNRKDIFS